MSTTVMTHPRKVTVQRVRGGADWLDLHDDNGSVCVQVCLSNLPQEQQDVLLRLFGGRLRNTDRVEI